MWTLILDHTFTAGSLPNTKTVLLGDPESQGDSTTTRAPGPIWVLGAHLRRQPVSGRGARRGRAITSGKELCLESERIRMLLPYLEEGHWGQGLEGFCHHLELYTQFAANAERSQTTLQEQLKKNKRFRRFVHLQEGRPEFGGLKLQDLLPLPLQRLQQYENLVVALAENTGPNSPDHQQLTRAARLISETAQRVHSIGQKQKNEQHLRRIQALLSGRQAKGLTSGRWFLRQGWLLVVPSSGEPRPRMFFLFSDVLLMAKPRPQLHLLQSGTFACKALYPMAQCQLCRVFGHSGGPCGGLLSLSFPREKLLLMSTDQEELSHWYHSLTLAISSQKN
ncbi:rho guanine nucleotide exchange factor 39 isoform X3 [Marmota marmota marmota]|uniref:rho guanine nucleotide exchange factor 39 isoform X3 n=1 Tax=Marmota marmota marmota TaxID=9994 RepID=UPI0020930668|nr:rho guanine nucleotide exchange factor 39 isoform X3 [Marmota marmota marmota]